MALHNYDESQILTLCPHTIIAIYGPKLLSRYCAHSCSLAHVFLPGHHLPASWCTNFMHYWSWSIITFYFSNNFFFFYLLCNAVCARVGGKEWYFYSQRDKKYATGLRTNRATISGYWKATGKDRPVNRKGSLVGMRKTLVFYQGRAPKGRKTDWVMHEFRLEPGPRPDNSAKVNLIYTLFLWCWL